MQWNVEISVEFGVWWSRLSENEQNDIAASALLLSQCGPYLRFPHSSWVNSSKHRNMRELRVRSGGNPFCLLYGFEPKRVTILLIGGTKGSKDRRYPAYIARADRLYDDHLQEVDREAVQL